ncbi:MAG: hypothetical protein HKP53_05470 [Eudoraea sp.]|nr:hypothetical protein [Eudoraea sp.]
MRNKYRSFEEIDRQLQILELKRKIDWEHVKFNAQSIKTSFSPPSMAQKAEVMIQRIALTYVLKRLLTWRSKKKQKKLELVS